MVMDLQPPQHRPRRGTSCHRHPGQHPTGLCAPCLRERLSLLNPSASSTNRLNRSLVPELRRCKTFSGNQCESIAPGFEPRRNSCDVRVRSSLWDLFNMDDEGRADLEEGRDVESANLVLSAGMCHVLGVAEGQDGDYGDNGDGIRRGGGEARVLVNRFMRDPGDNNNNRGFADEFEESKRIKELIDLEMKSGSKPAKRDFKEIAASFWIAASVFSRKLRNLRRRRSREHGGAAGGEVLGEMQIDQRLRARRQLRDAHSEAGEYGLGRRSCDTDPRCSVDLGRASVDDGAGGRMWLDQLLGRRSCDTDSKFSIDLGRASVDGGGRTSVSEVAARCSFEQPRASWDGSHVTSRTITWDAAPAVSVIENTMATVYRFENNGAVIGEKLNRQRENVDGHGTQFDRVFLHRQRERSKDFDRYCKTKHQRDETKLVCKGKASPATAELYRGGPKLSISEQEMRDLTGFSSLEDDSLGSSESASKDVSSFSSGKSGRQSKKCRRWSKLWSIWGLLQPQNGGKCGEEDKLNNRKGEDRQPSNASWTIPQLVHSYSSNNTPGPAHRMSSRTPITGRSRKRREESVSYRQRFGSFSPNNRSDRYSPSSVDNGLLRFYMTPPKNYRENRSLEKGRMKRSTSKMARTILRLY